MKRVVCSISRAWEFRTLNMYCQFNCLVLCKLDEIWDSIKILSSKNYNVLIRGLITFCYACIDTFMVFLMLYWSFFIRFFPPSSPIIVIFLLSSAGTQLLRTTSGVKSYLQREFLKVEEEILIPHKQLFTSPITLDDFSWAFGILRSRSFSRLRGQNLVLIPLADLVSSFFFFFRSVFSSVQCA